MASKNIVHNSLKSQKYFNQLFIFFLIISLVLTLLLFDFLDIRLDLFFLFFILIIFLILFLGVFIEYFNRGEYMNPMEIRDLEFFYKNFKESLEDESFKYSNFFNKFDSRTKKQFEKIFLSGHKMILSSIRKDRDNHYILTLMDSNKLVFLLALRRKGILHKLHVKKIDDKYRIIRID